MKRLVVVALAIVLAGCSNNDLNAPAGAVNATYSLRTIDGQPLPVTFSDGVTVQSDVLSLSSDGTYNDASQFSDGSVIVEQGYYDNSNGSITFQDASDGTVYQGSLSGGVLTEIVSGLTEVYQQQ